LCCCWFATEASATNLIVKPAPATNSSFRQLIVKRARSKHT
jgi:hypothetical protein